jgi:hypothetical protein
MNRLKKKAIKDFVNSAITAMIIIPVFIMIGTTSTFNAQLRLNMIIGGVVGGIGSYYYVKRVNRKESEKFDERELLLIKMVNDYSVGTFICYLLVLQAVALFMTGGKGTIPIWLAFVILSFGLFLAQCTASAILFCLAKEDDE